MGSNSVCVGVLSLHDSKESKAICNAVEALGHDPEWLREWNTIVHMVDGEVRLHPDVDVVANRMLLSNTDQPSEHIGIAETIAALRPTLNDPHATALAAHKIASATRLANAGLPVPETVFALNGDHLNRYR
ncbi:MAG: RimK/LysX family protein, partial [Halobacteriota archaeon]